MKIAWRWIRWTLAAALVLYCAWGALTNSFERCVDEHRDDAIVTLCGPPAITDASVLAVAAVFLILVWPDLSEFGAFGLSLKRRVENAEETAKSAVDKATEVATELHLTRIQIATAATASSQAIVVIGKDQLDQVVEDAPRKVDEFLESGAVRVDSVDGGSADENPAIALLAAWEYINERAALTRPYSSADLGDDIRQFRSAFGRELDIVRGVRNAVAHAVPVSQSEIASALEVANELKRALGRLDS